MKCALCGAVRSAGAVLLCGACAASVATGQDHTRPCACEHCERCDRAEDARDHTYDGTRDRVYVLDLPEVVEATARLQREATDRLRADLAASEARYTAIRAAAQELRDAEAAHLDAIDREIQSGEALPMTDESLRALKARMRPELERIEAARSALDALTREP